MPRNGLRICVWGTMFICFIGAACHGNGTVPGAIGMVCGTMSLCALLISAKD